MTNTHQGFSLFDLLLTLVFVSGTALGLVSRQWQIMQFFNTSVHDSRHLITRDNNNERQHV